MPHNPQLLEALKAFGLNEKQANIYLACLEVDLITVQNLAKKSGLKRTSLYSYIDELEKIGIIQKAKQGHKTYLTAKNPEVLLKDINNRREQLLASLPYFEEIKKKKTPGPKFIFYQGRDGFKNFWRDLLHSGTKEWLIITSGKEFLSFVSESYINNWIIKTKKEANIKSRQIISDSKYAREIIRKDKEENRESIIIGPDFPFPAIKVIYDDKVAIISSAFEDMFVVIHSAEVAQTHRSLFELIWKAYKQPKL